MPETKPAAVLLRELAAADPERHGQSLARGYGCGPQRIQLRRAKGWRKPASAVTVARPTKWGNPFAVVWCLRTQCGDGKHWHVLDNRDYYEADWLVPARPAVPRRRPARAGQPGGIMTTVRFHERWYGYALRALRKSWRALESVRQFERVTGPLGLRKNAR